MKTQQKKIDAILNELYEMHEDLFGQKYTIGVVLDENSEFKTIINEFRELIFTIKQTQHERSEIQLKKNYKNTPERLRINQEVREDIIRAENMLRQACKGMKIGSSDVSITQWRQKMLKNCYQLLEQVKDAEQGGNYKPPQYVTLKEIKKNLIGKEYRESGTHSINFEEQQAIDEFNQNDREIDNVLEEVIDVNARVRDQMVNANNAIGKTTEQMKKAKKRAEVLTTRVKKADKDLGEILKTYRRPSQLCLDITLILLILALIGVIINLAMS